MYELEITEARLKTVTGQRDKLRGQLLAMQRARDVALNEVELVNARMRVLEEKDAEMHAVIHRVRSETQIAVHSIDKSDNASALENLQHILSYSEEWT